MSSGLNTYMHYKRKYGELLHIGPAFEEFQKELFNFSSRQFGDIDAPVIVANNNHKRKYGELLLLLVTANVILSAVDDVKFNSKLTQEDDMFFVKFLKIKSSNIYKTNKIRLSITKRN